MEITTVLHGHIKELTPHASSIDASNAGHFKDAVRKHLEPGVHVVLNLKQLEFLDSSGLGALVWLLRELEARSGRVRLCELQKQVHLLLELVRMHRVFEICADTDQAITGWADAKRI
jgi:anti-sigma B factor antagonist